MKIKEGGVMDIQKEREAFQNFCEQNFDVERHEQTYFDEQTQSYENDLGECTESINMAWMAWQAKAQSVLEKDAVIKKSSDQLYEQEMKTSAARVLCETACELLDDYAHQDAMVILNDLEQAMSTGASQ